jgi:hypothetical protein
MMRVTKPGRAIVFLDGRFARVQLYRLAEAQVVAMLTGGSHAPLLTAEERALAERAVRETDGRVSLEVLMNRFQMGQRESRRLQDDWKARGFAANDPQRTNSLYITPKLADLLTN